MKTICILLALTLFLFPLSGCADGQDELYSRVLQEKSSSAAESSKMDGNGAESAVPEESGDEIADRKANRFNREFNYLTERPKSGELFDIEPNTEFSGTLTISVDILSEALVHWEEAFEAAYPNVDVVIKAGFDSFAAAADAERAGGGLGAANDQMTVDLFAGEAGDIVELGTAPYLRYSDSGLFCDLYQFMESDPDFRKEDYYSNLFEAWETADGQLPVIGPSVFPSGLTFNKLVLDEMGIDLRQKYPEGMNYQEIVDLFEEAVEGGFLTEKSVLGKHVGPACFNPFETLNYFDEQHSESKFDSPEFAEFLETMNEVPTGASTFQYASSSYPFTDRTELLQITPVLLDGLGDLVGDADDQNIVYQTYRLQNGGTVFRGVDLYGITSACENPELAWEFLKFMVSEKDFPKPLNLGGEYDRIYRNQYSSFLPINKENLKKLCGAYYGDEAVFQAANTLMESLSVQEFREGELGGALAEIYLNLFEYDLIDAQECAKQLQERAWIYFNE